jgi:hypothetical protein
MSQREHAGTTAADAWTSLLETVNNLLELVEQGARRDGVQLASLKLQCFDLLLKGIATAVTRLEGDVSLPPSVRERSRAVADRLVAHQRSFADVRLHLIDLAQDWHCAACGSDVVAAAAIVTRSPLDVALVCKACGARSSLTARGQRRLGELFGSLVSDTWNPALNGFVV